jgi:hypothetical protein
MALTWMISTQPHNTPHHIGSPARPFGGFFIEQKGNSMADINQEAGPPPDVATLEIIATWKADILTRYDRARLRYELIGGNGEEVMALAAEVQDFKRVCKVLKGVTQ